MLGVLDAAECPPTFNTSPEQVVGMIAGGHVLLEGVPGTAKTMLARTFAACLSLDFGRIQFTPDLMPGDVIGTNLFNFQTNDFALTKALEGFHLQRTDRAVESILITLAMVGVAMLIAYSFTKGSVSAKTDIVVAGPGAGSKA